MAVQVAKDITARGNEPHGWAAALATPCSAAAEPDAPNQDPGTKPGTLPSTDPGTSPDVIPDEPGVPGDPGRPGRRFPPNCPTTDPNCPD